MSAQFTDIYQGLVAGTEKLALVGLGYVGLPAAVEFAKHVEVIGFDVDADRISAYKNGMDATREVGEAIRNTTVDFTADPTKLKEARFIIVAVPTPVKADASPDLSFLEKASECIGKNLTAGTIVVFAATVYPGVTEEICAPIIEKASGLKCGRDWKIGYSPERVNPGDKVHTLSSVCKIISGMDEETAAEIQKVYDIVVQAGTYRAFDIKTAEAIKVIENTQRDVNIAFMNEIAVICDQWGIDTDAVLSGMRTKWNALDFRPGLVGGHCIGVDPYYLLASAEKFGCSSRLISDSRQVNDSMAFYIADTAVRELRAVQTDWMHATVVVLGVTFKENCPDIRNSKVMDIIKKLRTYGIEPIVADAWADSAAVKREHGVELTPFEKLPKADCVIAAVGHNVYRALSVRQLQELFKPNLPNREKVLLDVKSIYRMDDLRASGMRFWRL